MTNPFAPQPVAQQQAPSAPSNPFGPGVQQAGPVAQPAWLAQPTAAEQAHYQSAPNGQVATATAPAGPPPVLGDVRSVGAPEPSGDGKGAKFPDMFGRLALFLPLSITRRARNPQFITAEQRQRGDLEQDQVTATVVVLDDGQGGMAPISFGGDKAAFPPVPDTESAPLPYIRKGMWISQSKVIGQLRPYLPASAGAAPQPVAGRLFKAGPQRNDPWFIQEATPAELETVRMYLQAVAAGQQPHPLA